MTKLNRLFYVFIILAVVSFSCAPKEIIPPSPPPPTKPAKIALVLGAGASKGFAHIGVLKVLEQNKIPIHMIVGTSAGSFVGSLYASGMSAFNLQTFSFSVERGDIADFMIIPDNGFIKGDRLEEFVNKAVKSTPMENLKIPFYAVATDLQSGTEFIFDKGNTGSAVRASCSIPGIFRPVRIRGRLYVDGGVVSPVAVDAARRLGADMVIAVDISADMGGAEPDSILAIILQSISIMYSKMGIVQLGHADVVIKPKVGYIGSSDFTKRHEAVLEGEKAAYEALPKIQDMVTEMRTQGRLQ